MEISDLGKIVARQRGNMGVRAAAKEIGISPTTLSRIENGYVPDLKTMRKVCDWLGEETSKFTGIGNLQIAFKNKKSVSPKTSKAMANLIEKASKQFASQIDARGHS